MPSNDNEPPYDSMEFDKVLSILHAPLDAFPELRGQGEALLTSSKYDDMIHQLAHNMLLLGMTDASRCDIMRPVLTLMMLFGYVLGATGACVTADDVPNDAGPMLSSDDLGKLLGDIDLEV